MLKEMCNEALSDADIRAIGKARGFSTRETSSRSNFQNLYLSHIGLGSALTTLSKDEIAMLHLLKYKNDEVDTAFFECIYNKDISKKDYYFETYSARYKDVFSKVKASLVRKGLLLMAENKNAWNARSKMERWRFRLPGEFEAFLPSPLDTTVSFDTNGDVNEKDLKRKLLEVVKGKGLIEGEENEKFALEISDNVLKIGNKEFRVSYLRQWQRKRWQKSLELKKVDDAVSPLDAILYGFSQLGPNEWCMPDDLNTLLNVFSRLRPSNLDAICGLGWNYGCLAKYTTGGKTYYRLHDKQERKGLDHENYLTLKGQDCIIVDLNKIPLENLEIISKISGMNVNNSQLMIFPDLIRLGKVFNDVQKHPLFHWLANNSQTFKKSIAIIKDRRGKMIVHEDLLIARIKDLSLKVKLEKHFSDSKKFVSLSNEYIAFSRDTIQDIEKIVKKSGNVINRMEAK